VTHAGKKKSAKTNAPAKESTVNVGATEFKSRFFTQTVHTGTVTFDAMNNGGIPHNLAHRRPASPRHRPASEHVAESHLHEARQVLLPVHDSRPHRDGIKGMLIVK
jgi:hypothetical protein